MAVPKQIKDRYEIRQVLGQGGMGVVYNAYDTVVKRSVALKTVRDIPSRAALELFYKECDVLASISHPNIVEIFDLGEFDEDGASKPYFVMPLLPGKTLESLIRRQQQPSDGGPRRGDHLPDVPRPAGGPRARTRPSRSETQQPPRDGG